MLLRYIFILGSNWRLSLAEINHVLKRREYKGKIIDYSACAAIVEFDKGELSERAISQLQFMLGGTQKICRALDFIQYETFKEAFPEEILEEVHPGVMLDARERIRGFLVDVTYPIFGRIKSNVKYFVANSVYPTEFRSEYYKILVKHFIPFLNKFWVAHLKEKGAKSAIYYRYPQELIQSGSLNPIFPHHFMKYELYLPHRKEIVYTFTDGGMYIGFTLNVSNSNEMKMIDEERPYINMKASIPPKFAKVMINLLNLNRPFSTMKILDPFCGSGTILMFAYILGIKPFGGDNDQEKVEGTRRNINWLKQFLERPTKIDVNQTIKSMKISEISQFFEEKKFDGIVTEPILLPFYTELPMYDEVVTHIKHHVMPTYADLFKEGKKVLKKGTRMCLTAPSVMSLDGGRVSIDIDDMAKEFGYKRINIIDVRDFPQSTNQNLQLREGRETVYDENSKIISREFYLFEI